MLQDLDPELSSLCHWVVLGCWGPELGSVCLNLCKLTALEMRAGEVVTDDGWWVLRRMTGHPALVLVGTRRPSLLSTHNFCSNGCFEGEECGMLVVRGQRFRAGQRLLSPVFPSVMLAVGVLRWGLLLRRPVNQDEVCFHPFSNCFIERVLSADGTSLEISQHLGFLPSLGPLGARAHTHNESALTAVGVRSLCCPDVRVPGLECWQGERSICVWPLLSWAALPWPPS